MHCQFRNLAVMRYFLTPLILPLLRGDFQVSPLGKGGRKGGSKVDSLCSFIDRQYKTLLKNKVFGECSIEKRSLKLITDISVPSVPLWH